MASVGDQEVASLDRVLTRLAMTEEPNLQKVLSKLLPIVIAQLKSTHVPTRNKVLEILGHVNKRIKGHNQIGLPLEELLDLFQKSPTLPMVRNFSLVYAEMAFQRASPGDRAAVVNKIMEGVADGPVSTDQRYLLLRMAMAGLEALAKLPPAGQLGKETEFAARYPFLENSTCRTAFLDFALKVVLYQPQSILAAPQPAPRRGLAPIQFGTNTTSPPLRAALNAARARLPPMELPNPDEAMEDAAENGEDPVERPGAEVRGPHAPPGLSLSDVPKVEGKTPPNEELLINRKLGFLNFTAAAGLPPSDVVLHYLAAATDPFEPVSRRADELLKKRCGLDGPKPEVNLEDEAFLRRLFAMFLGTSDNTSIPEPDRIEPANPLLKARIVSLFCKSMSAANTFPQALTVVSKCVYGGGSTMRLKQSGMEFAVWVFKHAATEQLSQAARQILDQLLTLLNKDAMGSDAAASSLRAFTYQAVGQLAGRVPEVLQGDTFVAARFFAALETEPPGVRASLQETVATLASAYRGCTGETAEVIEQLLLSSITGQGDAARVCAANWAVRIFPFSSPVGRYLSIMAAGDVKLEVREAGLAGLKPPKQQRDSMIAAEDASYPSATALVEYVLDRHPQLRRAAEPAEKLGLPPKAFLALLSFLRRCWREDRDAAAALAESRDAEELPDALDDIPDSYLRLLEHALVRDGTSELHVEALESMLDIAGESSTAFAAHYAPRLPLFQGLLGHIDAAARDIAAKLVGIIASALPSDKATSLLGQVAATSAATSDEGTRKGLRFEERDGAMAAAGYLLGQLATGEPAVDDSARSGAAAALFTALRDKASALGGAAAAALGHAGLRGPLPLPPGDLTPPPIEGKADGKADGKAVAAAKKEAALAEDAEATRSHVISLVAALMADKDVKVAARAATAAGHLAAGDDDLLPLVLPALWNMAGNKAEELQFAVGEALCWAFGGVPVSADTVLRTNFCSLSSWLLAGTDPLDSTDLARTAKGSTSGTATSDDVSAARSAAQEEILSKLLGEMVVYSANDEVRAAGCVWLVSLVTFTRDSSVVRGRLTEIQTALTNLLGHGSEVAQEMASRGLSVVYGMADEAGKKELLDNLMGTLQGNSRKRRAVKVEGNTRVFEEGAVELPSGGSLTTYKELCALATDLGQPDLLYKFMDLANHAASLQSSRGAAFGFASIAKLAGEQLTPYVSLLIPKLYRYQYDPNPRVRDAMVHIWRALVAEPKQAVDANFDLILSQLLGEMGGNMWRNREASCLALADLLQGRRWSQVKDRFEEIWTMSFRVADDVKETTRQAGATAVRAVRGLTLRVCDPAASSEAAVALGVCLPLLIRRVMETSVTEERALSLTIIAKLAQSARPEQLRPHLPDLTATMLESLSGMEDERLNYMEQHTDRLGIDASRLENLRVSASKSSPMGDTLDICARVADQASLEALVPRLATLAKRGVGLNTRAGTARFIGSLATRLGSDVAPYSGPLIKALVAAATVEKSSTVRRSFAVAVGQVAKRAPEPRVAKLVADAVTLHRDPGDRDARQLSGLLLRELLRQAPEAFQGQAAAVLPLAFVARSDEEADVAAVWGDVWEEGASGHAAALRLYMSDLIPLTLRDLKSQQWGRKAAAAKAIVSMAESGPDALRPHAASLATALIEELPGRLWNGKEAVLEALAALSKATPAEAGTSPIVESLVAATGRKNSAFRKAALAALDSAVAALPGDHFPAAGPPLLDALEQHGAAPSSTSTSTADKDGDEAQKPLPLLESVRCLAAAWKGATPATIATFGSRLASALALPLRPEHPWAVRAAALNAVCGYTQVIAGLTPTPSGAAQGLTASAPAEPLGEERVGWLTTVLPGVLVGFEEQRVSQVRTAALEALAVILTATANGAALPAPLLADVRTRLDALIEGEKIAAVKAQAVVVRGSLPAQSNGAVPMATEG